jgi:assimilatory nitrate reductase catalytic subunit
MNWKRMAGIDTLAEEYSYARNDETGYTSAKKVADRWVPTTCGYCSVGCGIEIGVKENKAVASRPLASHPVNRGKLCPKGLSEHYIIDTDNRAKYPLLRKNGKLVRVGWDEALGTMVERFRATQAKYGPESLGVLSTGQLVTEEFYTLGKLIQLGFGTNNYDATRRSAWQALFPATRSPSVAMALPVRTKTWSMPTWCCCSARTSPIIIRFCASISTRTQAGR